MVMASNKGKSQRWALMRLHWAMDHPDMRPTTPDDDPRSAIRRPLAQFLLRVLRVSVQRRQQTVEALGRSACILSCNHQSFLDGIVLALCSPRPLVFTCEPLYASHTWWSKCVLDAFTWLGYGTVIPLGRENPWAMRSVAQALRAGRSVVIFPEGKISEDGNDGPVMPGLAWLQSKLNCPVIELRIEGAQRSRLFAKRGDQWWPRIEVRF